MGRNDYAYIFRELTYYNGHCIDSYEGKHISGGTQLMKFVERVFGKLSEGHNNNNKTEYKTSGDKYHKYTSREYSELCQADARRNIVIWSNK